MIDRFVINYMLARYIYFYCVNMKALRRQPSTPQWKQLIQKYFIDQHANKLTDNRIFNQFEQAYYDYLSIFKLSEHINNKARDKEIGCFVHVMNQELPQKYRLFQSQLDECRKKFDELTRCGAIVTHMHKGQLLYLMVQDRRTGKQGFPKGKIEEGESEAECAIRETMQQTDFKIQIDKKAVELVIPVQTEYCSKINRSFVFFYAHLKAKQRFVKKFIYDGKYFNEQITKFQWISAEKLTRRSLNLPAKQAIKRLELARSYEPPRQRQRN